MNRRNFVQLVSTFFAFLGWRLPATTGQTVWVVHYDDGEYSHPSGMFSSEEKAIVYVGNAPKDRYRIITYVLDEKKESMVFRPWYLVRLRIDGSSSNSSLIVDVTKRTDFNDRSDTLTGFYEEATRLRLPQLGWFQAESYTSMERAMQLAIMERDKAIEKYPEYFKMVKD